MSVAAKESEVFSAIRFPLTILVVFIHALPFKANELNSNYSFDENLYILISESISHSLGNVVVPCFFLLSGYYFFKGIKVWDQDAYFLSLSKRIRTLLIPYCLANILVLAIMILRELIILPMSGEELSSLKLNSIEEYMRLPINFPLWYIRDLMYVALLSPIVYLIVARCRAFGIVCLISLYLFPFSIWRYLVPLTGFTFFSIGAYFSIYKKSLLCFIYKYRFGLLVPILVLPVASNLHYLVDSDSPIIEYQSNIVSLLIMGGAFSIIALFYLIYEKADAFRAWCLKWTHASFFVYITHLAYIENWIKGAFSRSFFSNSGYGKLVAYFLTPMLTIVICIGIYSALKRFVPKVLSLLVGDRLNSSYRK